MITITDDMIQQAKEEADQAAQQLVIAEAETAVWAGPLTPQAAEQLGRLTARSRAATIRVDQLTAIAERQRAELAVRQAAELKADKQLVKMGAELTASRKRVATAVTAAQAAMVDAMRAAQAHNALIDEKRVQLVELGLGARDGDDHASMTVQENVRIRGDWWLKFDSAILLARSAYAVVTAIFTDEHRVSRELSQFRYYDRLEHSGVLDGVPALTPDKQPERLVARAARVAHAVLVRDPDTYRLKFRSDTA